MSIPTEKKVEILYDHYKDTFLHVRDYLKQRERYFVLALIVIFLQFLEISSTDQYINAFNAFVEKQFNFSFSFSAQLVGNLLWFFLFSISLRYFQINVLINRQYSYLHTLEDKLSEISEDEDFIRRDGQKYLKNYPKFSDWAHIIYTWIFPILLILVTLIKIILIVFSEGKFSWNVFISGIFFIAICISTILYLVNIHSGKKAGVK